MARTDRSEMGGRGAVAVADMKNRIAAGWTVEMLYERLREAEFGDGFSYDYAERSLDEALVLADVVED